MPVFAAPMFSSICARMRSAPMLAARIAALSRSRRLAPALLIAVGALPPSAAAASRRRTKADEWLAGAYSFSDELGGFTHHRRLRHRHQGRPDRHHRGAAIPRRPVTLVIRATRRSGRSTIRRRLRQRLHCICASRCSTTAGWPGSSSSSNCRRSCDKPSVFGDGLSFDQRATDSGNICLGQFRRVQPRLRAL